MGIAAILALVALLAPRAEASALTYAQLNPKLRQKVAAVPQLGTASVSVLCPKDTTLVTGGAFLTSLSTNPNGPDPSLAETSYLTSSYPTARGWHAGAYSNFGAPADLQLVVDAWCTRHAIRMTRIREDGPLEMADRGIDHACPGESQALAGGGFWHALGSSKPVDMSYVHMIATIAHDDARNWYAAGSDVQSPVRFVFSLVLQCSASLRPLVAAPGGDQSITTAQTGGGYSQVCPGASHVISGGAAWMYPSLNVFVADGSLRLNSSSMTNQANGWYAAGYNSGAATYRFEFYAWCLDDV